MLKARNLRKDHILKFGLFADLKDTIMKICAAHSLDIIEVLSLLKEKYLPIDSSKMYSSSYSVVDVSFTL